MNMNTNVKFSATAGFILEKVYEIARLTKMFDTCDTHGTQDIYGEERAKQYKKYFLKRIKLNIVRIDKKIEKLGGLDKTLEQMGSHQYKWEEKYNSIKFFLETRDFSDIEEAAQKPKPVTATELNTNNVKEYKSMHAAHKDLGINPGQIKMCCEGKNNVKTGLSKKDGKRYTFSYALH